MIKQSKASKISSKSSRRMWGTSLQNFRANEAQVKKIWSKEGRGYRFWDLATPCQNWRGLWPLDSEAKSHDRWGISGPLGLFSLQVGPIKCQVSMTRVQAYEWYVGLKFDPFKSPKMPKMCDVSPIKKLTSGAHVDWSSMSPFVLTP